MTHVPRLNAMTALCRMTAMKMEMREELSSCSPIARPCMLQRLLGMGPVFRIWIRTDPHKDMPPESGSAWTDADPDLDPGGKKA